jgi:hypothetical protein
MGIFRKEEQNRLPRGTSVEILEVTTVDVTESRVCVKVSVTNETGDTTEATAVALYSNMHADEVTRQAIEQGMALLGFTWEKMMRVDEKESSTAE